MNSKKEQLLEQLQMIAVFLKKYKIIAAVFIVFLTAAGCIYAAIGVTPVYYSTAEIYMRPNKSEVQYLLDGMLVSEDMTADALEIMQSTPVLKEAILNCGLEELFTPDSLREQMYVYAEYQSRIITVTAADIDPVRAQRLVQNICESAVTHINAIMEGNWAAIADNANVAQKPEYPVLWKVALQSFCFGMGSFFFLAVLFSMQDYRIRSKEDVEKYLGLSVLGSIPKPGERAEKLELPARSGTHHINKDQG